MNRRRFIVGLVGSSITAAMFGWKPAAPRFTPFAWETKPEFDKLNPATAQADAIKHLVAVGYDPESIASAVINHDFRLLMHTGKTRCRIVP